MTAASTALYLLQTLLWIVVYAVGMSATFLALVAVVVYVRQWAGYYTHPRWRR